jgi:hypothetical protein
MRHRITLRLLLVAALAVAAFAVPAATAGDGAVQTVETWTNEPAGLFYNSEGFCTGQTVAGYGTSSGTARITDTPGGGFHIRGQETTTWQLYEASGPPWDVTFGDFVGTWTVTGHFDEQLAARGAYSSGSVARGTIVYADGSTESFQIVFRFVVPPDSPPQLFLVKFVCAG